MERNGRRQERTMQCEGSILEHDDCQETSDVLTLFNVQIIFKKWKGENQKLQIHLHEEITKDAMVTS